MSKQPLNSSLFYLTDAFRRAATFENTKAAEKLIELTKQLGTALTWYYPEYDDGLNHGTSNKVRSIISEMADTAKKEGLSKIELPLVLMFDGAENPTANWIQRQIIDKATFSVPIVFMNKPYDQDLSKIGFINDDLTKRTVLDEGISGIVDKSEDIRSQWANEKHVKNQLGFDF